MKMKIDYNKFHNILTNGDFVRYYKYATIDFNGYVQIWRHKPRFSMKCLGWVPSRSEYINAVEYYTIGRLMKNTFEMELNCKKCIWEIQ